MARRIHDLHDPRFRTFTKGLALAKRGLSELAPEREPEQTTIIHNDTERRAVGTYLLAKHRDTKTGGTTHLAAFRRDRQQWRVIRRVMARIPIAMDDDGE